MVRAHTKAEIAVLPPHLNMLGCSTAAHSINLHKFLTAFVVGGFMYHFDNFTQPAVLYWLLHSICKIPNPTRPPTHYSLPTHPPTHPTL